MDIVPILSTIILISTLITLIVAIASYMTFRIKEKKKQAAMAEFSEVFSSDLAELQEASPVETLDAAPTVESAVSAPPSTTVIITPPVVVSQPQITAPIEQTAPPQPVPTVYAQQPTAPPQLYPAQPQYPQQQAYPQQAAPQPPLDPFGMPLQFPPPQSRGPQFSGAQAAFMKGFGGAPQQNEEDPQAHPGDFGQPPTLRRFTPPEPKPRKEPPPSYKDDSAAWK